MEKVKTHMDSYPLSKEQIDFYDENGYLLIKNVFPKEDIDLFRKDMDDYADDHFTNKLDSHYYNNIKRIHRGKKLCDIGDAILRDRAIPIGSIAFYCKPNNPLELGSTWHQDNYAGKSPDGNNYLNLAVAIDDADESNGSLLVVPGSHKLGDLPCNPKPNFDYDEEGRMYQSAMIGNDCELPEDLPVVQLEYKSGDVMVVNGLIVHKANRNNHPTKWRRTMYFVYIKDNEAFWPGWTAKRELLERYDSPKYVEEN
tara:strand:- start:1965 stop:2729 length:765 start_codon:yes stop_codon:yes gene_type:complete